MTPPDDPDARAGTETPGVSPPTPDGADDVLQRRSLPRLTGVQWMLLMAAALVGGLIVLTLAHRLAASPTLDAQWTADARGQIVLEASDLPALQPHLGHVPKTIVGADGVVRPVDNNLLQRAVRWIVDDVDRARVVAMHQGFLRALQQGPVTLGFDPGGDVSISPQPRGAGGLGPIFWPLASLALLLHLVGAFVWIVRPRLSNALFAAITTCQAGNLLFIAFEIVRGLPLPDLVLAHDLVLRMAFDVVSAAAILHACTLHPTPLPGRSRIALAGWLVALAALATQWSEGPAASWWWPQGTILALGAASLGVLTWSYRIQPNPLAVMTRRFGAAAVGSLALLTVALAAARDVPGIQGHVAEVGSGVWYVFFASLLLLVPFLSRSRQLLREVALVAGIAAVASSLDLLFGALFSLGQFASVILSVVLSLGLYIGARRWILDQLAASHVLPLERSFEKLYRVAREVERHPERHEALLLALLQELFEPLETYRASYTLRHARAIKDGSSMLVPSPGVAPDDGRVAEDGAQVWVLRYARRGKRLFTADDARLADRVCEQLRIAVAYDKAVERGRSEERLRIAQDLHDDIGARLLTLMYQAHSPEMEDYVRHTLQDLKTLTRGLSAPEHRLSHAAAEWKADIGQRLTAADIVLDWSFAYDRDTRLSVVQWSALTRVLRELVSNVIYHARAGRVRLAVTLFERRLALELCDDGCGRDPAKWTHGLGLGGVRKRVRSLGGRVEWRESAPTGIVCEVVIDDFDAAPPAPAP